MTVVALFLIMILTLLLVLILLSKKNLREYALENPDGKGIMEIPKQKKGIMLSQSYIKNAEMIRNIGYVQGEYSRVVSSTEELLASENEALNLMVREAELLGANAVLNVEVKLKSTKKISNKSHQLLVKASGYAFQIAKK